MKMVLAWALAAAPAAASPPQDAVTGLGWLAGRWETPLDHAGQWTEEVWLAPRGGMMVGLSRSGRGGRTAEYEYMRLEAGEDGVPVFWATVGGNPPVGFRLVASDAQSAAFENRAHDFPQRITYRRDGDRLVAAISAADGSSASSWTYRRSE
jgi:hypothetical protein